MKNENVNEGRVTVLWRSRKVLAVYTFILVCGFSIGLAFCLDFAQYTRSETWLMSSSISILGVLCISACVYFFIGLRTKKEVYYIYPKKKFLLKIIKK